MNLNHTEIRRRSGRGVLLTAYATADQSNFCHTVD